MMAAPAPVPAAAPAYTRLAGPISRAGWRTGYGMSRWRKQQFREMQRQFNQRMRLSYAQLEGTQEALEQRAREHESRLAYQYEALAAGREENIVAREHDAHMEELRHENRVALQKLEEIAAEGRLDDVQQHQLELLRRRENFQVAETRERQAWEEVKFWTMYDRMEEQDVAKFVESLWASLDAYDAKWQHLGKTWSPGAQTRQQKPREALRDFFDLPTTDLRRFADKMKARQLAQAAMIPADQLTQTAKERWDQEHVPLDDGRIAYPGRTGWSVSMPVKKEDPAKLTAEYWAKQDGEILGFLKVYANTKVQHVDPETNTTTEELAYPPDVLWELYQKMKGDMREEETGPGQATSFLGAESERLDAARLAAARLAAPGAMAPMGSQAPLTLEQAKGELDKRWPGWDKEQPSPETLERARLWANRGNKHAALVYQYWTSRMSPETAPDLYSGYMGSWKR